MSTLRMKIPLTVTLMAFLALNTYCQDISFIKDSIVNEYMKNGYANKHFRPIGQVDRNNLRQGDWKDFEVENDFMYISKNGAPYQLFGLFLLYGEGKYVDGKRQGFWNIYALEDKTFKKILQQELTYEKGVKIGDFKYYYPSGKLGIKGKYALNNLDSEVISYDENGNRFGLRLYQNGSKIGKHTYLYPNGKLKLEHNFVNDTLHGLYHLRYPNGNTQEIFNYAKGKEDGDYKYYYENGQLWIEKVYNNGLLWNVVASFDNKGNPRDKGTLKDGNGTINYYTEDGKIYMIQTFKDGVKIKEEPR